MNRFLQAPSLFNMHAAVVRTVALSVLVGGAWLMTVAPAGALDAGDPAPEIDLTDLRGGRLRLSKLRNKVVLVDFWASWCGPCRQEMPLLNKLYTKYRRRGLVVVGVNVDRDIGMAKDFLRSTPVQFPVVHDAGQQIADRYRPAKMPSSYLIDRRGRIRFIHEGFEADDAVPIERHVLELLRSR